MSSRSFMARRAIYHAANELFELAEERERSAHGIHDHSSDERTEHTQPAEHPPTQKS